MSDQAAEQIGGESGSLNPGVSHSAGASSEPVTASAAETSAAADVPVSEPSMPEPSMSEPVDVWADGVRGSQRSRPRRPRRSAEASAQAAQPEAAAAGRCNRPARSLSCRVAIAPGQISDIHAEPEAAEHQSVFGKRRIAAIAAVVALATVAGALGGAFATATFMHGGSDVATNGSQTCSRRRCRGSTPTSRR